jgi:phosphoribosyl 1,2-cyclic phosphodiesterase
MQIRFWGTRGSIAKPGASTLRYGGNTSCVEVRAADGTLIVLDCGTGAHGLGLSLMGSGTDAERGHMLISHTHWDHIQGFPFFAPLRSGSAEWNVYGPRGVGQSLRDTFAGQMNYTYFPVDLSGLDAHLHYHDIVEGVFELGDVRVEARYLNHPAVTLGYRLEADGVVVVYATDHEPHSRRLAVGEPEPGPVRQDDAHAAFLEGADLVIHDCQYTAAEYPKYTGYGHSTVEYVVDRTIDKGVGCLALFHHDPMRDDRGVDRIVGMARARIASTSKRMEVIAAAEGQSIELLPARRPATRRDDRPLADREPEHAPSRQRVLLAAEEQGTRAAFRHAAAEDGISLTEAAHERSLATLIDQVSPSVVIAEAAILAGQSTQAIKDVQEGSDDGAEPVTLVGLFDETKTSPTQQATLPGVDEWVATPLTREYARSRLRAWLLRTGCCWRRAPLAEHEEQRIDTLRALALLDTPAEERFDRHTRIAAALFNVPTALISLVDVDRQWFKSRVGLGATETPRDRAFCAHAILGEDVFQVTDARTHPDFADNPLVTGAPHVRFYAGIPLTVGDDDRVGTLCLIDYLPRELSTEQLELLRDLGKLVERELVAR